jgi:hypothetical protein
MVNDVPTAPPAPPGQPVTTPYRQVAAVQGVYFLLTGLWPLVGIDSFQAVTGRKMDLWLVYTVGTLVSVIGLTLLVAANARRITPELGVLAIGSAVGLAAIDVIFVARGVLSGVYLVDAVAELALIGWWILAHVRVPDRPPAPPSAPEYPHLQALLNRGRSVSPS